MSEGMEAKDYGEPWSGVALNREWGLKDRDGNWIVRSTETETKVHDFRLLGHALNCVNACRGVPTEALQPDLVKRMTNLLRDAVLRTQPYWIREAHDVLRLLDPEDTSWQTLGELLATEQAAHKSADEIMQRVDAGMAAAELRPGMWVTSDAPTLWGLSRCGTEFPARLVLVDGPDGTAEVLDSYEAFAWLDLACLRRCDPPEGEKE